MVFNISERNRIIFQLTLAVILCLAQIVIGEIVNAKILVTNGFHLFTDVIAYIISLISIIKKKKVTESSRKTFGYRRAEALGALTHGALLLGIAASTATEAILALADHKELTGMENSELVLIIGCVSVLVDICGLVLFWQDEIESANMNIRSLFLEKIADLSSTLFVILASALEYGFSKNSDWTKFIDPVGTLAVCVVLLWASYTVFKMTLRIILNDAPRGYDVVGVRQEVQDLGCEITNLNIWQIDNDEIVISCSINTEKDIKPENVKEILRKYSEKFETQNFTVEVNAIGDLELLKYSNDGFTNKALMG